jgi:hydrogenase maturation protease
LRIVVLGIGNILLSDEGIGVHAVNALAASHDLPPEVEIIDGGTSAMDCLDQIASVDLLLIADCMRSKKAPGTITRLEGDELNAFFRTKISPHQVGLCDVLATLLIHDLQPKRTILIGIEPLSFALGMEPTPEIAAQLPALVAMLATELSAAGVQFTAPLPLAAE